MELASGLQSATGRLAILVAVIIGQRLLASAVDFDGSSYARNVSLDADLDIFWTIDYKAETIRVAVHAKDAAGWVGMGISEMGGMEGADIVFYEAASGEITDTHSLVAGAPITDECTQDWTLLSADVVNRSLVFEVERALDTGDAQDRVFVDDTADGVVPTILIAAWGDSETVSYHGTHSAKASVVVFGEQEGSYVDPLLDLKSNPDVSFFDVTTRNFTVPTTRTHYEYTCLPASALPDLEEFHVVGFEGVVETDTSEYVHHLVVRGYHAPDCGMECLGWELDVAAAAENSTNFPEIPAKCAQVDYTAMFVWTPGVDGVAMPEEAGFRFDNSSGGFASVLVNTHFDNPNGDAGVVDSSGVRVYYTEKLRPMDMGMMILGDPFITLLGTPISNGRTSFSFGCPSSCTEEHFEVENVTIFSHFLHMHENGRRLETRQYRNDSSGNEVLVDSAEVEYYSFLQAGGHVTYTDGTATIQKGDRFETECFYDTALSSVGSENVTFGLGSEQEMCLDFVAYYPIQRSIPVSGSCGSLACGGAILETVELGPESDFNRTFAATAAACGTDEEVADLSASSRVTVAGLGFSAVGAAALWLIGMPLA